MKRSTGGMEVEGEMEEVQGKTRISLKDESYQGCSTAHSPSSLRHRHTVHTVQTVLDATPHAHTLAVRDYVTPLFSTIRHPPYNTTLRDVRKLCILPHGTQHESIGRAATTLIALGYSSLYTDRVLCSLAAELSMMPIRVTLSSMDSCRHL
jgi:hypothetical protein